VAWHIAIILLICERGRTARSATTVTGGCGEALRNATPLIEPRLEPDEFRLTQKAPQRRKPAEEVDLESLRAAPRLNLLRAAPRTRRRASRVARSAANAARRGSAYRGPAGRAECSESAATACSSTACAASARAVPEPFEPVGGPRGSVQGQSLRQSKVEIPDSSFRQSDAGSCAQRRSWTKRGDGRRRRGRGGNRESVLADGQRGRDG